MDEETKKEIRQLKVGIEEIKIELAQLDYVVRQGFMNIRDEFWDAVQKGKTKK